MKRPFKKLIRKNFQEASLMIKKNSDNILGLEKKIIVVTGGSRGIGAAIADLLNSLGARVVTISRTTRKSKGIVQYKADVTKSLLMKRTLKKIEKGVGPIYGVVANAGVIQDNYFSKIKYEDWRSVIDVNLHGVFNTLRPVFSHMYSRSQGAVVFISSVIGERGNIGQANYSASKAALIGMGKSLALEGARYGIRVNMVAPGFIETRMLERIPPGIKEQIRHQIPFKRFGSPEEVAWAVAFLLSPVTASYITGEVLRVNGGFYT